MSWLIEALMEPAACARPRATTVGGRARVFMPSATIRWQHTLALRAQEVLRGHRFTGPVQVDLLAVLARPKRLSTAASNPGLEWAPVRPDADNVAKNVLDALRFAWNDDAQVTLLRVAKAYAPEGGAPRVVIRIASLDCSVADVLLRGDHNESAWLTRAIIGETTRAIEARQAKKKSKRSVDGSSHTDTISAARPGKASKKRSKTA